MPAVLHNKKVLGLIVAFALAALALLFFGGGGSAPAASPSPYLSVAPAAPASALVGQDLLAALALLKTIRLDISVFTNPVFESLSDWGKTITSQPVGRRNPFAPLGAAAPAAKPAGAQAKPATSVAQTTTAASSTSSSDASVWDFSDIDFSF